MLVKVETPHDATSRRCGSSTRPSPERSPSWPTWPGEPGFTGAFDEYLAQTFPSSTAADFAVLESGVVSEETYVEQGLKWETFATPVLTYIMQTYQPDLALVGYPTTDEFQHQFLGLIVPKLPNGAPNPAYDDVAGERHARRAGRAAYGVHPRARTGAPTAS